MRAFVFVFLIALTLLPLREAAAACTSPAGVAGRIEYISSAGEQVFHYCNGTDWVPWAGEPVSGQPAPIGGFTANDISDITITSPASGECLSYNGSAWVNSNSCGSGGGIWSDSGSGYIEYGSTLGGIVVNAVAGLGTPSGAVGSSGGGGGGTPAGAGNGEIQFNSNGLFEASGSLYYDSAAHRLYLDNLSSSPDDGGIYLRDNDPGTPDILIELSRENGHGNIRVNDSNGQIHHNLSAQDEDQRFFNVYIDWSQDANLGIDDASPDARLEVSGNGDTTYPYFMLSSNDDSDGDLFYVSNNGFVGIGDTNPSVALDVVGDINYTGVIVDVSDIRVKSNIAPIQSPLQKLISLNGFSFTMKDDPSGQVEYGVSAQDVQKVFPELVHKVDSNGTLGVSYDGLIAPMIEAIKELKAENDMLKARIEALENERTEHHKPAVRDQIMEQ
jgi:hypothetical protein